MLRAVGASYGAARANDYVLATTDQFLGSEIYLHTADINNDRSRFIAVRFAPAARECPSPGA